MASSLGGASLCGLLPGCPWLVSSIKHQTSNIKGTPRKVYTAVLPLAAPLICVATDDVALSVVSCVRFSTTVCRPKKKSDAEFDRLKSSLRESGSVVAVSTEPKCYIDTGICTVTFQVR